MRKEPINVTEWSSYFLEQLPKGALFSVADGQKWNTMTIGWGAVGIEWSQPIFIAYIRNTRYTWELLKKTNSFTVSFPLPKENAAPILRYCGRVSGRDEDKFAACNLTAVRGEDVNAPAILQLPVTLECEIIFHQDQNPNLLPPDIISRNYPPGEYHTAFYGKIVNAYILHEE